MGLAHAVWTSDARLLGLREHARAAPKSSVESAQTAQTRTFHLQLQELQASIGKAADFMTAWDAGRFLF